MTKDGGSAFPEVFSEYDEARGTLKDVYSSGGMSLRDYFAASALQGMLASDSSVDRTKVNKARWAMVAYAFADAMLAARKRGGR